MGTIKIGTSGFSFNDWKGAFYPEKLPKSSWFSYYIQYFPVSEINSTYYSIPSRRVFENLNINSPDDFEFIVKLNKESTHVRKRSAEAITALNDVVTPIVESRKLKGFLAQFPYAYKNTGDNRRHLVQVKENCKEVPLFVEFRNYSWNQPAVFDFLKEQGILYCCVDEPRLRGLIPPQEITTGGIGYVRFHGRNSETWWDSSKGDRYDYLYKTEELSDWLQRIREISRKTSKTYLFFNNCHAGHAVKNAKMMAELLKNQFNIDAILQTPPDN